MQLPALYQDLFTADKSWSFTMTYEARANGKTIEGGEHGIRCTVDAVQTLPNAAASAVHCVGGGDTAEPALPRGIFVATADGLWQTCAGLCKDGIRDLTKLVASLDPAARLMSATPTASRVEWKSSDDGEAITQTVAEHAGSWCITTTRTSGAGTILCLQAGKGIAGGRGFDHVRPDHEAWFGDVAAL